VTKARNGVEVAIVNLQGRAHLPAIDCPFRKADAILQGLDPNVKVRLVDFHAELTSEKMAMGWHLNGRVSAVLGTHTTCRRPTSGFFRKALPTKPTWE